MNCWVSSYTPFNFHTDKMNVIVPNSWGICEGRIRLRIKRAPYNLWHKDKEVIHSLTVTTEL